MSVIGVHVTGSLLFLLGACLRLLLDTVTFNFKTSNKNGDVKNKYCLMVHHCYIVSCMASIKMNVFYNKKNEELLNTFLIDAYKLRKFNNLSKMVN